MAAGKIASAQNGHGTRLSELFFAGDSGSIICVVPDGSDRFFGNVQITMAINAVGIPANHANATDEVTHGNPNFDVSVSINLSTWVKKSRLTGVPPITRTNKKNNHQPAPMNNVITVHPTPVRPRFFCAITPIKTDPATRPRREIQIGMIATLSNLSAFVLSSGHIGQIAQTCRTLGWPVSAEN